VFGMEGYLRTPHLRLFISNRIGTLTDARLRPITLYQGCLYFREGSRLREWFVE
jgi:hypothetical protein